ncbi:MAG: hypothetical protein K2G26_03100, partial [Clostridia bacterium]|nr:hypothetical protein [Clostridia bacterium]
MKRSLLILLTIASLCSLIVGLTACAGGKTAYDIYKDTYFETKGDYEGVLSEEEWLESLHGVDGVGIEKIDIVCGDVIIYFDDDSTKILKSMLPEAGHNWDSG